VKLPSSALVRVNRVNDQRGRETERVAQWEDKVWLSFEPSAAILLKD
jgi:putrescine transport system ATP-binding protein